MIKLQELAGMAKEISSKKWFLNADEEVTAIDNDALPDDTEEAFIGCAANIQLAKYMAAANPETILAIAEAYSALEQRLKAAEAEVQRLNATSPAVSLVELVPDEMPQYIIDELEWRSEKKDGLHCYHMENAQRSWDKFRVAILRNIEGAK